MFGEFIEAAKRKISLSKYSVEINVNASNTVFEAVKQTLYTLLYVKSSVDGL